MKSITFKGSHRIFIHYGPESCLETFYHGHFGEILQHFWYRVLEIKVVFGIVDCLMKPEWNLMKSYSLKANNVQLIFNKTSSSSFTEAE